MNFYSSVYMELALTLWRKKKSILHNVKLCFASIRENMQRFSVTILRRSLIPTLYWREFKVCSIIKTIFHSKVILPHGEGIKNKAETFAYSNLKYCKRPNWQIYFYFSCLKFKVLSMGKWFMNRIYVFVTTTVTPLKCSL